MAFRIDQPSTEYAYTIGDLRYWRWRYQVHADGNDLFRANAIWGMSFSVNSAIQDPKHVKSGYAMPAYELVENIPNRLGIVIVSVDAGPNDKTDLEICFIAFCHAVPDGKVSLETLSAQGWTQQGFEGSPTMTTPAVEAAAQANAPSTRESTFIVASDGSGDFLDLQSAINALGNSGGKIFVRKGTYNVGSAGIRFSSGNILIEGEGPSTRFNFNAVSLATCFSMADANQRSLFCFRNFRISQQGTPGTGVAFDFSHFAESTWENIRCDGVNGGFLGNASGTLYNRLYDCTVAVSGSNSYGFQCASAANENVFYSCRCIGTSNSTGFAVNAHAIKLCDPDAEAGLGVGIDVQLGGNDCVIVGPYLEGNVINLQIAKNVQAVTIIGGFCVDATTSNVSNLGARGLRILNLRLQYHPFSYNESLNGFPGQRWVKPFFYSMNTTSQAATPGRVYLLEFELQNDAFIDGVSYLIGSAVAGNVTAGIYGPVGAEETCNAAPVLVQSNSVPQSGNPNQDQLIPFPKTLAREGRYYVAIEFDSAPRPSCANRTTLT
jgi:hypothetical protein